MAQVCLRYLSLQNFSSGHCTSEEDWRNRIQQNPFLGYAASYWWLHVKSSPESRLLSDASFTVLDFLDDPAWLASCGQALWPTLQISVTPYTQGISNWSCLLRDHEPLLPALHLLAYFGLKYAVQEWLDKVDGQADRPSPSKFTALFLACRLGHHQTVQNLLGEGANPSREFGHRIYCLSEAIRHGKHSVVRQLLRHESARQLVRLGDQRGRHPIGEAIAKQDMAMVRAIIEYVPRLDDCMELVLHQDDNGYGVLHQAVNGDKTEIMQKLVELPGGDALLHQSTRKSQDTPLHLATVAAKLESIRTLIHLGANTAATQSQGRTPLHLAAELPESRHDAVIKLLLKNGAKPGLQDSDRSTALHAAVRHGRARHVRTLSRARGRELLDSQDASGRTALFTAVAEWRLDIALYTIAKTDLIKCLFRFQT
jgi:ankyrin repeat protein